MKSIRKYCGLKGFTLIELIVVIAVLGILAAIAYPATKGILDKSRKEYDRSQAEVVAKQIELAFLHRRITETRDFQDNEPFELIEGQDNNVANILVAERYITKLPEFKYYNNPMKAKIDIQDGSDDIRIIQIIDSNESEVIYDSINP